MTAHSGQEWRLIQRTRPIAEEYLVREDMGGMDPGPSKVFDGLFLVNQESCRQVLFVSRSSDI